MQAIIVADVLGDVEQAAVVDGEVAEGEDNAHGLLDAEDAVERPLAVELVVALARGVRLVRESVAAGVCAFVGTRPQHEAEVPWDRGMVGLAPLDQAQAVAELEGRVPVPR